MSEESSAGLTWDRVLSITAIVVSIGAAAGTVWQARIAEQALRLASDKPTLHIVAANLNTSSAYHHTLAITLKDTGQTGAYSVYYDVKDIAIHDTAKGDSAGHHEALRGYYHLADMMNQGDEIVMEPGGEGAYTHEDIVSVSGTVHYSSEDGNEFTLPYCFTYLAFDPEQYKGETVTPINCLTGARPPDPRPLQTQSR